jgi:hypothetical protein
MVPELSWYISNQAIMLIKYKAGKVTNDEDFDSKLLVDCLMSAYMTSLFKVLLAISEEDEVMQKNVILFIKEMEEFFSRSEFINSINIILTKEQS